MLKEFKEFAMKGNLLDLAFGIIMGVAFGKIISSLVADIIMPPIGLALGKVNFSQLFLNLGGTAYPTLEAAKAAGAPTINYGMFIQAIVDFVIVALVIFMIVKGINASKRREAEKPAPPPGPTPDQKLLTEIRDLLSARR